MIGELWPQTGLRGLYHLASTTDSSGNGYNLTNNNTVTFIQGKYGNGANFVAASSQSLTSTSDLAIDISVSLTTMAWVKINTEPGTNASFTIIDLRSGTGTACRSIGRYIDESGTKKLYLDKTGTGLKYTVTLGTTDWHHIAFTNNASNHYIYLDGNLVATGGSGVAAAGTSLSIGGSVGNYSNSLIDEVAIFSTELSANQIRRYYAWSKGRFSSLS